MVLHSSGCGRVGRRRHQPSICEGSTIGGPLTFLCTPGITGPVRRAGRQPLPRDRQTRDMSAVYGGHVPVSPITALGHERAHAADSTSQYWGVLAEPRPSATGVVAGEVNSTGVTARSKPAVVHLECDSSSAGRGPGSHPRSVSLCSEYGGWFRRRSPAPT
jgi:hypothetical protein